VIAQDLGTSCGQLWGQASAFAPRCGRGKLELLKAARRARCGGLDTLRIKNIAVPELRDGKIVLQIRRN